MTSKRHCQLILLQVAFAVMAVSASAAPTLSARPAAIESVYTPAEGPECTDHSKKFVGSWECRGVGGYAVSFFDEGNVVALAFKYRGQELPDSRQQWRGADRAFGSKIEWRLDRGRPYASILRVWRREDVGRDGAERTVQELMVMRIGPAGVCRMAGIPASRRDANEAARDIADTIARQLPCPSERGTEAVPKNILFADCARCVPIAAFSRAQIGRSFVRVKGRATDELIRGYCELQNPDRPQDIRNCIAETSAEEQGSTHSLEADCRAKIVRLTSGTLFSYSPRSAPESDPSEHWINMETGERSCGARVCDGPAANNYFQMLCPSNLD